MEVKEAEEKKDMGIKFYLKKCFNCCQGKSRRPYQLINSTRSLMVRAAGISNAW